MTEWLRGPFARRSLSPRVCCGQLHAQSAACPLIAHVTRHSTPSPRTLRVIPPLPLSPSTLFHRLPRPASNSSDLASADLFAQEQKWDSAVKRPLSLPKMLASIENKAEAGVAKRLRKAGALNRQVHPPQLYVTSAPEDGRRLLD